MTIDRRQFPRLHTECPIDYRSASSWQYVLISNICAGGIFITTDSPEMPGTEATLDFRFGKIPELITAEGRVIWIRQDTGTSNDTESQPQGMGIAFTKISERVQECLNAEICRLADSVA